ncbi:uncharacterized protein LOC106714406 [Papilio machaon]|uniref:uncharacterized protein LOC106714406 n=1 Tax=Papilio machaon TaxID=76193 RepID=UPI001E665682|nr:uncharacterized protein LOC106714406 [Papilio machaon]
MIYTVLLIILVSILGTNGSKPVLKMPPQMAEKFMAAATHCIKETGAPEECLKQTLPWKMPQNELTEKFLYCLGQTTKLAKSDGHYIPEKVMRLVAESDMKDDIEKTIMECNALEGENVLDVNFKITDCFHEKAPIILSL